MCCDRRFRYLVCAVTGASGILLLYIDRSLLDRSSKLHWCGKIISRISAARGGAMKEECSVCSQFPFIHRMRWLGSTLVGFSCGATASHDPRSRRSPQQGCGLRRILPCRALRLRRANCHEAVRLSPEAEASPLNWDWNWCDCKIRRYSVFRPHSMDISSVQMAYDRRSRYTARGLLLLSNLTTRC